jgi:hypothetical protein
MKLQFLFRFDRPFVWPAAGLNPEPWNPKMKTLDIAGGFNYLFFS